MKKNITQYIFIISFSLFCSLNLFGQYSKIWGTATTGGANGGGTIYNFNLDGTLFNTIKQFNIFNDGIYPRGKLCRYSNGKLFGIIGGGEYGYSVVFEYDPQTNIYTKKLDLNQTIGTSQLQSFVKVGSKLYSTSFNSGTNYNEGGVLFEYDPILNICQVLHQFDLFNEGQTSSNLFLGSNGKLYGNTMNYGQFGKGIFFEFDIAINSLRKIVDFDNSIIGIGTEYTQYVEINNIIYGISTSGGLNNSGVLFKYNLNTDLFSKVLDFEGTNVLSPYPKLVKAINGKVYGFSSTSLPNNVGAIFEFDPQTSTIIIKCEFINGLHGDLNELISMEESSNGMFYGTTWIGGPNGHGTLFEFDPNNNSISTKAMFNDVYLGGSSIVNYNDSIFYGTIYNSTPNGLGGIYRYDCKNNLLENRIYFYAATEGANPTGKLLQANDSKVFGISKNGGSNGKGVLYSIDPQTFEFANVKNFYGFNDGAYPVGGVTQIDNYLFGLTQKGGIYNYGTIYQVDLMNGSYSKLFDLDSLNSGAFPNGVLTRAVDGNLYGLTTSGGNFGFGILFKYDYKNNQFEKLIDFDGLNIGSIPMGSLYASNDNLLYGFTKFGGPLNQGTSFKYDPRLKIFTKVEDLAFQFGIHPEGNFIRSLNGNYFSMRTKGSNFNFGFLYNSFGQNDFNYFGDRINTPDHFNTTYLPGKYPTGSLIEASNGDIFGIADEGGLYGNGVIFKLYHNNSGLCYCFWDRIRNLNTNDGTHPKNTTLTEVFTNRIQTGLVPENLLCSGSTINIPFTATGVFNNDNVFTAQLSNEKGLFNNPKNVGSISTNVIDTFIVSNILNNIPFGAGYRIRVISSSPPSLSVDNGFDIYTDSSIIAMINTPVTNINCPNCSLVLNSSQSIYQNAILQWRKENIDIPGETNSSLQVGYTGIYSLTITENGCIRESNPVKINFEYNIDTLICKGSQYLLPDGNLISDSGEYIYSVRLNSGCDSTIVTQINFVPCGSIEQPSGNPTYLCSGNNEFHFNLTEGNIVRWEYSIEDENIWHQINTGSSVLFPNIQIFNFNHIINKGYEIWKYRVIVNVNGSEVVSGDAIFWVQEPYGGIINGTSNNISLGSSTGALNLIGNFGYVTHWERQHNGGNYELVPGSQNQNLLSINDFPPLIGTWNYRAVSNGCGISYSEAFAIEVFCANPDDENACTNDYCDPLTGNVSNTPIIINDDNACTIDACDTLTGDIIYTLIDFDDYNSCTIDGCNSETGVYHIPVITDDGNACTIDYCDINTGIINHIPNSNIVNNDTTICSGSILTLTASRSNTENQMCLSTELPLNIQNGLIAFYPFCGNANDGSGNENQGIVNGATLTNDRHNNPSKAFSFDGIDDYIYTHDSPSLSLTGDHSISFWIYDENDASPYHTILNKRINGSWGYGVYLSNIPGGTGEEYRKVMSGRRNNPDADYKFSSDSIEFNSWANIIVIVKNDTITFYKNGLNAGYVISTGNVFAIPMINQLTGLTIGSNNEGGDWMHGKLDDIGIWNRALSDAEAQQIFELNNPTFLWSTGETTSSINVSPVQTTTFYCTITQNDHSCVDSVTITVNPTPIFNLPDTIHSCESIVEIVAGTGFDTYLWNTSATTQAISVSQSGWYYCTVSNTICSTTDSVYVNILIANILQNDTIICSGNTVLLSATSFSPNLQNSLLAYYPFNGNANDESGNGNHGTVNGPLLSTDRNNIALSAFQFDGSDDFIQLPFAINSNTYSISAWVNPNIFGNNRSIVGDDDEFASSKTFWLSNVGEPQIHNCHPIPPTCNDLSANSFVSLQQWSHLICSVNNGEVTFYLNGQNIGAQNGVESFGENWRIGVKGSNITQFPFSGMIDDVAFFNRALTPQEVNQLYTYNSSINYLWSTGASTLQINVSPTETTTYYLTATQHGFSCIDSITISVRDTFSVNVNAVICQGTTFTLPDGQVVNVGGNYISNLQTVDGCDSIITTNLSVNPIFNIFNEVIICQGNSYLLPWGISVNSTGDYSNTYTSQFGCDSIVNIHLIVNPVPILTTNSNSPVCSESSLHLSASGGSTYNWTGPNGFSSTQQNPIITNVSSANAGTYIVTVNNNGDFWQQRANLGPAIGEAIGFNIGTKGYIGTGIDGSNTASKNFWEYDPILNIWTQKADFGGVARFQAIGFSIGDKGYIGTGCTGGNYFTNDFWEYNQVTNSWSQKANLGMAVGGAVGFSIGNKGYVGTGIDAAYSSKKEFWQYDPTMDVWTQMTDFGGDARYDAVGFSIGNKGYIGTGSTGGNYFKNDFWEYDPIANNWSQKANLDVSIGGAVGFSIGTKGYIGTGTDGAYALHKEFWEYNPNSNDWIQKADFGGIARYQATGFSIGNQGYIGSGTYSGSYHNQDFWEYNTTAIGCTSSATIDIVVNPLPIIIAASNSPICSGETINLFSSGGTIFSWTGPNGFISSEQNPILINSNLSYNGSYTVTVTDQNNCSANANALITINPLPTPTITSNGSSILCNGESIILTSSNGASYLWNNNASTPSITTNTSGNYSVTVTNEFNCSATSPIITLTTQTCPVTLKLKVFIEGFYLGGDSMRATIDPVNLPSLSDIIVVELHNPNPPYNRIRLLQGTINIHGQGNFTFPSSVAGNSYYIVVKHRNSVETWSKYPVLFSGSSIEMDFTR